jgi:hypothetical protein
MLYGDIRGRVLSFLTSELHASATSNPAKVPRYARNKSLGGPQSWSERLHENNNVFNSHTNHNKFSQQLRFYKKGAVTGDLQLRLNIHLKEIMIINC